jgi:RNA polymerase sigma-70 factor (ECF subfamily)
MGELSDDVGVELGDYERLGPELLRFATGLVGGADAADVLSSVIVKAFASSSWPTVRNQRAYLYRAVYHEALTWRRRSARRGDVERAAAGRVEFELPEFDPAVRQAVEQLSVQQRAVVLLTYWADLNPTQAAERLGISEGSVRRHLARARARLRKVLDD